MKLGLSAWRQPLSISPYLVSSRLMRIKGDISHATLSLLLVEAHYMMIASRMCNSSFFNHPASGIDPASSALGRNQVGTFVTRGIPTAPARLSLLISISRAGLSQAFPLRSLLSLLPHLSSSDTSLTPLQIRPMRWTPNFPPCFPHHGNQHTLASLRQGA